MHVTWKANKTVTGCLSNWGFNTKDDAFYLSLVAQSGWNTEKSEGIFSGGNKINLKFKREEIGGILDCLETHEPFKFYHAFGDNKSSGNLQYSEKKVGEGENEKVLKGFVLFVSSGEKKWRISYLRNEARELKQFLIFALGHCYNQLYADNKKRLEEVKKKAEAAKGAAPTPKTEPPAAVGEGELEL
jgi:hypothetical protein